MQNFQCSSDLDFLTNLKEALLATFPLKLALLTNLTSPNILLEIITHKISTYYHSKFQQVVGESQQF